MKIIAKTRIGQEFLYNTSSMHSVSDRGAAYVVRVLNEYKYKLKEGETWHAYEPQYGDLDYTPAAHQRFSIYRGIVKDVTY